jgi:hypothetical protein
LAAAAFIRRRCDDGDLRPPVARKLHELRKRPDAIDADELRDLERVFLGIDHQKLETHQVRVLPRNGVSATRAHAAGEPVGARGLAQQCLRKIEGERVLADAARTVNEQRMRKARALAERRTCRVDLPGH